jgi:glycerophosphoryl diester phosphodiesterase
MPYPRFLRLSFFTFLLFIGFTFCTQPPELPNENTPDALTSYEQWMSDPYPVVSAHRGGPYSGYPENAIETFSYITDRIPAVIECDVAMTKDSVLILMHDRTLDRTTTGSGAVSDYTYETLEDLRLLDQDGDTTSFSIPLLSDVLVWGKDKALFTLDVKRGVPFEMVTDMIAANNAEDYAAVITYSYTDAEFVHRLNPDLILSVSLGDAEALNLYRNSEIPADRLLAFVGTSEPEPSHYVALSESGILPILGTLGNLDRSALSIGDDSVYEKYVERGAMIIATDRPLEVAAVIGNTE